MSAQSSRYLAGGIQNQQAPVAGIADDNVPVTENDSTSDAVQKLGTVVTDPEQWRLGETPFRELGALLVRSLERLGGFAGGVTHGWRKGAEAQNKSGGE